MQTVSALEGLLQEDTISAADTKLMDNAWRGAEVLPDFLLLCSVLIFVIAGISLLVACPEAAVQGQQRSSYGNGKNGYFFQNPTFI